MKAEFFQGFEAVNNPATTTAPAHLGSAELHSKHPVALEAHVLNSDFIRMCFHFGLLWRCTNRILILNNISVALYEDRVPCLEKLHKEGGSFIAMGRGGRGCGGEHS